MTQCIFQRIDDGRKKAHRYRCLACGHERESNYPPDMLHRNCGIRPAQEQPANPGNILHRLIRESIGMDAIRKCQCDKNRILMNMWGPAGCRENLDWIVSEMLSEAQKRNWTIDGNRLLTIAAKVGTKLPGGMMFARSWARALVLEAIELSEKEPTE